MLNKDIIEAASILQKKRVDVAHMLATYGRLESARMGPTMTIRAAASVLRSVDDLLERTADLCHVIRDCPYAATHDLYRQGAAECEDTLREALR